MTLEQLAAALDGAERRGEAVLDDATHDSRQARPGMVFCAIVGAVTDGHEHAAAAVDRGASALLVERWLDLDVPQVKVPDSRAATGPAAARVHGMPSADLTVVGITGTNGKTTSAYLVEAAFGAAGRGTGLVGTVETRIHGDAVPGLRTTPEGTDVQRLLAAMRDRGVDGVAMEVSSHGLELRRVDGTRFAVAVFTNLSQDHLDFHPTMDAYLAAKQRLFTPGLAVRGIVTVDGSGWGERVAAEATIPVVTLGTGVEADVRIEAVRADLAGTAVRLHGAAEVLGGADTVDVETRLVGAYNGRNAAGAYLAAVAAGVPAEAAAAGIAACPGVPGRLEPVDVGQPFTVLVDYAHTPDAVATVLATLRPLLPRGARLIVVLGAGGERDQAKRPLMGAAAAAGADVAVLTSDNPRSEDPQAILDAVAGGAATVPDPAEIVMAIDRRRAIAAALDRARPGDVVVIAGKGHETTQDLGYQVIPFDDREVTRELLAVHAAGAA